MKDTSLAAKQAASKKEQGCGIPFSRREFAMIAVIASAAMSDADIIYQLAPQTRFKTDEDELDGLATKLTKFLDTE